MSDQFDTKHFLSLLWRLARIDFDESSRMSKLQIEAHLETMEKYVAPRR